MYFTTIFCAIMILSSSVSLKQEIYKLPPEKVLAVLKYSIPCAEEYNVDPSMLQRVFDRTLPQDDDAVKKYLYCFALKGGFIEEDGHTIVDRLSSLLGNHPLLEEYKETLRNCNKITKENHFPITFSL